MKLLTLLKYLRCPYCYSTDLVQNNKEIYCDNCDKTYDVIEGIPIFNKENKLHYQEKKQILIYNKHYSEFSKYVYKLENWRLSMLKRVIDLNFDNQIKIYLDVGCGATGYTVIEAAKRNKWLSFGMDISIEAMVRAKYLADKLGLGNKTGFVVASAENLPFKIRKFDYISMVSVLEHILNDQKVINGVYDLLNKNGYMYVCVPNTYKNIWPFFWPIYWYYDNKAGHKRHYSIEQLNTILTKNNMFKLIKVFYNGHLIKCWQLLLEKLNLISEKRWWEIENIDINSHSMGLQLNAIYRKQTIDSKIC